MKAVILAGGVGSRLSEETVVRPKPLVEIGGRPILWHILKIYGAHGINDFIICCGYRGHMIKQYFADYFLHHADIEFDVRANRMRVLTNGAEPWTVTVVDTGEETMTGGRLKRVQPYLGGETFCATYGDGVADVDISALVAFHRTQARMATLTAVRPPGRFGAFTLAADDRTITSFREKPRGDGAWINGGFFVLEPAVLDLIPDDRCVWEHEPLTTLAERGELAAYRHTGFWQPMDTLRDKAYLERLWHEGAPWRVWDMPSRMQVVMEVR